MKKSVWYVQEYKIAAQWWGFTHTVLPLTHPSTSHNFNLKFLSLKCYILCNHSFPICHKIASLMFLIEILEPLLEKIIEKESMYFISLKVRLPRWLLHQNWLVGMIVRQASVHVCKMRLIVVVILLKGHMTPRGNNQFTLQKLVN